MVIENYPWTALSWAPEGKRKGQPEETWQHTVEKEQQQLGLRSGAEAITVAPDSSNSLEKTDSHKDPYSLAQAKCGLPSRGLPKSHES